MNVKKKDNSITSIKLKNDANIDESSSNDSYNNFYDLISIIYRVFSFAFFGLFLFYIIATAFSNASEFSFENFEYIIRNFALTLEENQDDSVYAIEYNPDAGRSYGLFGEGLSLCGSSGITVYSPSGRVTCSEPISYKIPKLVSSNKYALVYDISNTGYSVYNSFNKVYSEDVQGKIRGAAVSDLGYYALITSSDQYTTSVELYDDTFTLINRFNKLGFVVDVDINNAYLCIATVEQTSNNTFITEIQVFDIELQQETVVISLENNFPLKCSISDDGVILVGNNYITFYNFNNSSDYTYNYVGDAPINFSVDENSAVLLFKDNGFDLQYRAVVLRDFGESKYDLVFAENVNDVELCDEWVYFLVDRSIVYTNGTDKFESELNDITANSKMLSFATGSVYVCNNSSAQIFIVP